MNIFLTTEFWIWQFSDTYLTHFWQFSRQIFAADIFLTVAQRMFLRNVSWSWLHKFTYFWHISDSFTDPTLTVFWHNYEFRHISETFPILIWQISDRILNLTVFWHISGSFLTHFQNVWDQHSIRVQASPLTVTPVIVTPRLQWQFWHFPIHLLISLSRLPTLSL